MKAAVATAACACLAIASPLTAGTDAPMAGQPASIGSKADSAYQQKDWSTASTLYQKLTMEHPESYLSWTRLAVSLRRLGQNRRALEALERAQSSGGPAGSVLYQVAIVRAAMGERNKALDALAAAVAQGHGRADLILAEPEFRTIREDSRFADLLETARKNDAPCRFRGENRQFDFWLGDWTVATTQEHTTVGASHIESVIGDCAIWENWTSLSDSGYTGKSYNVYNAEQKRWEQFWIDNQGGVIHFFGNPNAGVMDFHTDPLPQPDGKALQRRLRFFNEGADQVRQLSEGSTDNGSTWTVEYDFTYTRLR